MEIHRVKKGPESGLQKWICPNWRLTWGDRLVQHEYLLSEFPYPSIAALDL